MADLTPPSNPDRQSVAEWNKRLYETLREAQYEQAVREATKTLVDETDQFLRDEERHRG